MVTPYLATVGFMIIVVLIAACVYAVGCYVQYKKHEEKWKDGNGGH